MHLCQTLVFRFKRYTSHPKERTFISTNAYSSDRAVESEEQELFGMGKWKQQPCELLQQHTGKPPKHRRFAKIQVPGRSYYSGTDSLIRVLINRECEAVRPMSWRWWSSAAAILLSGGYYMYLHSRCAKKNYCRWSKQRPVINDVVAPVNSKAAVPYPGRWQQNWIG